MASSCARGDLDGILGKISLQKGLKSISVVCSEKCGVTKLESVQNPVCMALEDMLNREHGGGAGLMIELLALKGLFQS